MFLPQPSLASSALPRSPEAVETLSIEVSVPGRGLLYVLQKKRDIGQMRAA